MEAITEAKLVQLREQLQAWKSHEESLEEELCQAKETVSKLQTALDTAVSQYIQTLPEAVREGISKRIADGVSGEMTARMYRGD